MGLVRPVLTHIAKGYGLVPGALALPAGDARAHSRRVHSQALTTNFQYMSNDNTSLKVDPSTMKLDKRVDKPLCIIMNWMLARPQHVMKYANLYLEQGFDVVSVSCTPWQLMWPLKGSQLVGAQVMRFMAENGRGPLALHGFSVGAYVWAEGLVFAMRDKDRYQPVLDRVASQVWDSAASAVEIPVGFPSAVFPRNMFLQNALRTYTKYHLKRFHSSATSHYLRASAQFHRSPCRAPALFLLSRADPVGAEGSNRAVRDSWQEMGIKCTWQCWDRSPHVLHYSKHPQEYLQLLSAHLLACGVLPHPDRMQARMAS